MTGTEREGAQKCTQHLTEDPEGKIYTFRFKNNIQTDRLAVGCKTS